MRSNRIHGFLVAVALFAAPAALGQTSFSNTNPISLPATPTTAPLAANPYPSTITVSGLNGTVSKVTVTLNGWNETSGIAFPGDRAFMLVSPSGATFEFLGGVGSFHPFSGVTLVLDDSASSQLTAAAITSGTFQPTNRFTQTCANYPSPAPASSHCAAPEGTATFASVFNGSAPNGSWSLYVMDILTGDPTSTISGGWAITITVAAAANTSTSLASSLDPSFTTAPDNSVTLTATVTSGGSSVKESTVTFFDGTTIIGGPTALNSSGQAQLITSFTTEGSHALSAKFNGDSSFGTSTGFLTQEVDNQTVVTGPTFCNPGNITLNTTSGVAKPATPYPQRLYVSGLTGSISAMTLQLPSFSPSFPEDVDILLVSPNGATFVPLASAGGAAQPSGVTLTLSDSAASLVPHATTPTTGTFLPSDYNSAISFPAPAPGGTYNVPATQGSATFGSSFAGLTASDPHAWSLYVFDHAGGDSGTIGGYCLTFTTSSAAATTTMLSSNQNPAFIGDEITLTATVTSGGSPVTSGTVTFKENGTVLAGPTAVVSGSAAFTTSTLSEGIHNITALYSGVPGSLNVSSGPLSQEIDHHTTVSGTTYCNGGGITIPANGGTQPYPSRVFVTNLPGTVSKVTASLDGFTHAFPSDLGALLTGPTGTNLVLWSNAGGNSAVSGLNVTLDDAAGSLISSPVTSGTFKPTAIGGRTVIFPTPAPASPSFAATAGTAALASSFDGINPNGAWSFYLFDENTGSGGTVNQVCLDFTENPVTGTGVTAHVGPAPNNHMRQGGTGSVTFSLLNNGVSGGNGSTGDSDGSHPMVVAGTLPSHLTLGTAPTGTPWNCSAVSATVTCTSNSAVPAGSSYPLLTLPVNVDASAPATATVSGFTFGGAGMTAGPFSSDTITIDPAPVLALAKTHTGTFTPGSTAAWNLQVSNNSGSAAGATDGSTVTVSDTLPAGYTLAIYAGTGWFCTGSTTVNCTSTQVVAGAGGNFDLLTLTVNVPANSPVSVTNNAKVFGGGDLVHTNSGNGATGSDTVTVVSAGPVITTNPVNATLNAGATAVFTAAASGTPTPTVQWQVSTDGGATFTNLAGATTTTLSFTVSAAQNGNKYRAVFTNASGSATTTAATLTVDFAPSVTTNPQSHSVSAGSTATFTAAASGNPTPTVQWQVSTDGGATFNNLAGATTTTLSFTATVGQNGNQFRSVFTNSVGSTTTTAATLTVTAGPVITTNPVNATLNAGATAVFTAAASGAPTPTVQWQVSTNGGTTFTNLAGATTTTLSFTVSAAQNGNKYQAVFTNAGGSATTTAATLTVDSAPTVVSYSVVFGSQSYNVIGSPRNRLPWQITGITVTFSKPIATGNILSLGGVTATTFGGLGTSTLTWAINPVALGALSTTLAGSGANALKDAAGTALAGGAGFSQALKILEGDFNDDGVVNAQDFVLINTATSQAYNIFADINGDGVVNLTDVTIARGRNGTSLP